MIDYDRNHHRTWRRLLRVTYVADCLSDAKQRAPSNVGLVSKHFSIWYLLNIPNVHLYCSHFTDVKSRDKMNCMFASSEISLNNMSTRGRLCSCWERLQFVICAQEPVCMDHIFVQLKFKIKKLTWQVGNFTFRLLVNRTSKIFTLHS